MILKSLADYYQRLVSDPGSNIPPTGFQIKKIPNIIVIDINGQFVRLAVEEKPEREYFVPRERIRSGSKAYEKPNYLWDSSGYITGYAKEESEKTLLQHDAFKNFISKLIELEKVPKEICAVHKFYSSAEAMKLASAEDWNVAINSNQPFSFRIQGENRLICQHPWVINFINREKEKEVGEYQVCLVSGMQDFPVRTLGKIKNVWGQPQRNRSLISFNKDSFCSFGKKQSYNSPIGEKAEFAYTTALNYLLASERQRMQVGDASTVFWASEKCSLESDFPDYLSPKKGEDAVSYGKIRSLLQAVKSGIPPGEADMPFYVFGLAPNASRIAVRFWYEGSVKEIKERIAEHFQDIAVLPGPNDPEFLSLHQLLLSVVPLKESDRSKKIPPTLGGDMMRAVLDGTLYPRTLLANVVLRSKAEQRVTYARAAVIKGCLVRTARMINPNQKEVTMALDKSYTNIGYVLGRLFAVLERIQEQAQGRGLNKTIRDTYFSSAASSPIVAFKRLNDLSIHHLAKIRNSGKSTIWLEQQKQEVYGHIPPQGIPAILTLEDQGRFSIGYYHQRQDFFTKKNDEEKGDQ